MKTYPMPAQFDGAKFAARYGLNPLSGDFYSDGVNLYVPDKLPDDPPIFEAPDPPKPRLDVRLDGVRTLPELVQILKDELSK